jgi:hypothetical protein
VSLRNEPQVCGYCRYNNKHVHDYGMYFLGPKGRLRCECPHAGHLRVLELIPALHYIKQQLGIKSNDELARRLGVTRPAVEHWLNGRARTPANPGRAKLYQLALQANIKIKGMERG